MSLQNLNIGTSEYDFDGDSRRTVLYKLNTMFSELYSGAGGVFAKNGAAGTLLTGTLTETILAQIPVPANSLGQNGFMRVSGLLSAPLSANAKNLRLRLGTTGITSALIGSSPNITTVSGIFFTNYTWAANATNAQTSFFVSDRGTDHLQSGGAFATSAVDMTQAQILYLTGQLANVGDSMQLLGYLTELFK